jgi:hypothetical protein
MYPTFFNITSMSDGFSYSKKSGKELEKKSSIE